MYAGNASHLRAQTLSMSLPARTFRDSMLRPNSLDAILEAANTPFNEAGPSELSPYAQAQGSSYSQYGSVYTGIPSPDERGDLFSDDEETYPFPRTTWVEGSTSSLAHGGGFASTSTVEFSAESAHANNGDRKGTDGGQPRSPKKLRKTPPAAHTRRVNTTSGRRSPGRRSPTRRSPSRRPPSLPVAAAKRSRRITFFGLGKSKKSEPEAKKDGAREKEKIFQGMEAYVVEPFESVAAKATETKERQERPKVNRMESGRPMSVTSLESSYSYISTVVNGEERIGWTGREGAPASISSPCCSHCSCQSVDVPFHNTISITACLLDATLYYRLPTILCSNP
jgi:hypothetical protein